MGEIIEVNQSQNLPATTNTANMIQLAIEKNIDVDKLEKLLELHERNERRLAEQQFSEKFAEMQKTYVPAFKTKFGAKNAYKYCPLPQILEIYAPILAKFGFSYRWEELELENNTGKIITCFLTGYGFTRSASETLPYALGNAMLNPIQARGATSEYGRRYSFLNVTGCIVADEADTDAKFEIKPNFEEIKKEISSQLQYIPDGLRAEFVTEIEKSDIDQLTIISRAVSDIKTRAQKIIKNFKGVEKQKMISSLKNVENVSELEALESYAEEKLNENA